MEEVMSAIAEFHGLQFVNLTEVTIPATAGVASPPIVNVGKMRNSGFDFSVGHQSATWSLTFNGSHYPSSADEQG